MLAPRGLVSLTLNDVLQYLIDSFPLHLQQKVTKSLYYMKLPSPLQKDMKGHLKTQTISFETSFFKAWKGTLQLQIRMLWVGESVFHEWRSGYLDSPREDLHEDQHSNKDSLKAASAKHFSKADSSLSRWESRKSSGSFRIGYYWISLGCEEL